MTMPFSDSIPSPAPILPLIENIPVDGDASSPEKHHRRNLTQAFEALLVNDSVDCVRLETFEGIQTSIPTTTYDLTDLSDKKATLVSPTSVQEFDVSTEIPDNSGNVTFPAQSLHPDLQRELSIHCIRRVSCYSIIHDINKECSAMAHHDPLLNSTTEKDSPLVYAARDTCDELPAVFDPPDLSKVQFVVIDEEQWLLSAIASRTVQETHSVVNSDCPSTFLQAIGEKEYDPVQSVTGHSRTQLWKPSRSWWEAKSGKNPWIEPTSHNKRWRYLWPLIHYHKFLAKCIKKLKRNGVDVKMSISPVSVFLREEVCAVSDHLAAVSLFDSDEWMACLQHFEGWTIVSPEAEKLYKTFIQKLPLRSLDEPGDVESPVLRSQIDESFLRAIAAQREQLRETNNGAGMESSGNPAKKSSCERITSDFSVDTSANMPINHGHPPVYQRVSPQHTGIPRQIHGVRRPRFFPQTAGWYSWEGQPFHDNSSVHSELSANSFPQQPHRYDFHAGAAGVYPMTRSGHLPPAYYPGVSAFPGSAEHSLSSDGYAYAASGYHDPSMGWIHPYMAQAYALENQPMEGYFSHPVPTCQSLASPSTILKEAVDLTTSVPIEDVQPTDSTPFKYDPDSSITQSPYWSHLDQGTIAMGLATPVKPPTPMTPRHRYNDNEKEGGIYWEKESTFATKAQAPLLRQHYYSVGNYSLNSSAGVYGHDGYIPPSPATQFMMSPHAHLNAGFAYNYGYGFSPRRNGRATSTPRNVASKTIPEKGAISSPLEVTKMLLPSAKPVQTRERHSPSTVETTTDSESFMEQQNPVVLGQQSS